MTLQGLLASTLAAACVLAWLYLQERTKNIARERTERTLADYRHQHETLISAVNADHQRRLEEFGLYARRQHAVYSKLYRRVRQSSDLLHGLVGLHMGPDFRAYSADDAREFMRRNSIPERLGAGAVAAYESRDLATAAQLMTALDERVRHNAAERAFVRAKNIEALYELYLSDQVRQRMGDVRASLARVSSRLGADAERFDPVIHQDLERLEAAVAALHDAMRSELRRGSAQPGSA